MESFFGAEGSNQNSMQILKTDLSARPGRGAVSASKLATLMIIHFQINFLIKTFYQFKSFQKLVSKSSPSSNLFSLFKSHQLIKF